MKELLNFIFIFSLFLGPYLSVKSLYVSHIVIVLLITYIFLRAIKYNKSNIIFHKKWYNTLPYLAVLWMIITIFWSQSVIHSIIYIFYYVIGLSIIFINMQCFSSKENLYRSAYSIKLVIAIIIPIALLELLFNFRLPLSQSSYSIYQSEPTVFWGNPNNLATILNLVLPFILFSKNRMKWFTTILIFFIIYYTNSRLNLVASTLVIGLYFLYEDKRKLGYATLIFILTGGILFLIFESFRTMVIDLYYEFLGIVELLIEFVKMDSAIVLDSTGVRQNLYLHGLEGLINSNYLGVGAGASPLLQVKWLGETGAMHNFWLEILVEQGIIFFIIFISWYGYLIIRNFLIYRKNKDGYRSKIAGAISISLLGFFIGALSPSSTIYMLPMWLIFGLALVSIQINNQERRE